MFLLRVCANDERFKAIEFKEGLNLIVADRTEASDQRDSRNGTGKSSTVLILRYILGSSLAPELYSPELAGHIFKAGVILPSLTGGEDHVTVDRPVSPTTRLDVRGWSATNGRTDIHIDEWRELIARHVWKLPEDVNRPSPGQLWGQFIRTYYGAPTKVHATEAGWETGVRLGYLLGLAPEVLGRAGELSRLIQQRKAIRRAVEEGVISHVTLDEAGLRAQLAAARRNRQRVSESLRAFRVDEQYGEHQRRADGLSTQIRALNDEALVVERRLGELARAVDQEADTSTTELQGRLARVYNEVGIVLPELVARRFDEVAQFHESVVRNRRSFLQEETEALRRRLERISEERTRYDTKRAEVMQLLNDSVALNTFMNAQASLSQHDAEVADLERRLESATSINEIDVRIKLQTAETVGAVRAEITERGESLDRPISLFNELGTEIYTDREASLLISPSNRGNLNVKPQVSGDASDGIRSVETYLLDMVCLISGTENGRAPSILVHDSHLFDAIDHRQVASCLNIGARLAEQYKFQYIVTMNSDTLESVVKQSDGAFDPDPYRLPIHLTDESQEGGLFGFRFK
jgi:uncharacterized protein YydD (DUF2326 family)